MINTKFLKYFTQRLTNKKLCEELNLDFSQPGKIEDLNFSRETPTPYIPVPETINDYPKERAKEFLDKFQEVYLASDNDKYVIATVIRNLVYSPDLVDLTESDLLDLADAISKL
jgi:hypothetical protein